jgi:hypothetical protein
MTYSLAGTRVLIVGGSSGIAAALAADLRQEGARVEETGLLVMGLGRHGVEHHNFSPGGQHSRLRAAVPTVLTPDHMGRRGRPRARSPRTGSPHGPAQIRVDAGWPVR